ncbi:MAG: lysylphosphatidylglycerol synthase domain-containing protein [Gammaproteobacteria bacterium]
MSDKNNLFAFVSRWLIALGLLVLIFIHFDASAIWAGVRTFDPVIGVIMVVLDVLLLMVMAARWKLIAEKVGIHAGKFKFLRAIWLASLSGQAGPPIIFAEYARYKALSKYADKWTLITSQVLDRLTGQITLLLLTLVLLPVYLPLLEDNILGRVGLLLVMLLVFSGAVAMVLWRFRSITNIDHRQLAVMLNPLRTPVPFLLSLTVQGLLMISFFLAVKGAGDVPEPLLLMLLVPLIMSSLTLMPISVADWGSREVVAVYFLSFAGVGEEQLVAASLVFGLAWSVTALFGIFFLWIDR